jgi:hypothetical protein
MDILGSNLLKILAGSGATFGSVYTVFSKFDEVQSDDNRAFTSKVLLGIPVELEHNWATFFSEIFTRFFGKEHLSLSCAVRSVILTTAFVAIIFVTRPGKVELDPVDFILIWTAACVSGYINLGKTRYIFTHIEQTSMIYSIALVAIDVIVTLIVYLMSSVVVTIALEMTLTFIDHMISLSFSGIIGDIIEVFADAFEKLVDIIVFGAIGFLSFGFPVELSKVMPEDMKELIYVHRSLLEISYLTSIWLWAYVIAIWSARFITVVPLILSKLSGIFDLQKHPVRVIGFIAGVISALVVAVWNILI